MDRERDEERKGIERVGKQRKRGESEGGGGAERNRRGGGGKGGRDSGEREGEEGRDVDRARHKLELRRY